MRVYSDLLERRDLGEALPPGVWLAVVEPIGRPRKRARGWVVGLSGSSPYRSQLTGEKAATWDEHGVWMNELFRRDPQAVIGCYDGRDAFLEETASVAEGMARYAGVVGKTRRGYAAPWLERVTS